ncbi:MAG TPA: lanthionine synthetase C family protein [Bacteroidia bacterium]|jgi:hypothetical protein|nr:lanthionine synthetase C family protein [Bacteroidia bacterium]
MVVPDKKDIHNKIEQIKIELLNQNSTERKSLSLMSGMMGELLFYYNYCNYIGHISPEIEDRIIFILNKIISDINNGHIHSSYSGGLAGIRWGIDFLNKREFFEIEEDDSFNKIDDYLNFEMNRFISMNDYDYLHGSIGIALYFLEKCTEKESYQLYIENFVKQLISNSISTGEGKIAWKSYSPKNKSDEFNLGLSHGIPSIIVFLSKCIKKRILKDEISNYLTRSVTFLLDSKLKENQTSLFSHSDTSIKPTRLAWCYGDLGIASSIWQAGIVLNNEKWKNEAVQIMLFNATRKDLEINGVKDAGLCHGTSGIAHIFNRFYKETNKIEFYDAGNYWFNETLKMAKFHDGLASYKTWEIEDGWQNGYDLLTGICGVGLSLLGCVSNDINNLDWDACLMLS